jgi:hypothetical protein
MKTKTKIAVLLASGLASFSTAHASTTDLLLGFNDAGGPPSAQNDYVIDLGLNASTLVADALANNGTYDLSSSLNPVTFNSAFGSDGSALNDVAVGVVGGLTGTTPAFLYQTDTTGNTPAIIHVGAFNNAAASAQSPTVGEYGSSSASGWTAFVAASPSLPGTLINGHDVADNAGNPLTQLGSGVASEDLWAISKTGSSTLGNWVDEGTLNINLNSDSLIFTLAPTPEPPPTVFMAGAGLLVIMLRHIKRKNA